MRIRLKFCAKHMLLSSLASLQDLIDKILSLLKAKYIVKCDIFPFCPYFVCGYLEVSKIMHYKCVG